MIWTPHTTVAAIIEREQRYLLVEELIDGKTVLNQPAGHLEDQESLIDAVIRETREETAWRFHPAALQKVYLWRHPRGHSYLRFAFTGKVDDHHPRQALDEGIRRAIWLSREEVAAQGQRLRSPLVLQCIDDHIQGHSLPLDALATLA